MFVLGIRLRSLESCPVVVRDWLALRVYVDDSTISGIGHKFSQNVHGKLGKVERAAEFEWFFQNFDVVEIVAWWGRTFTLALLASQLLECTALFGGKRIPVAHDTANIFIASSTGNWKRSVSCLSMGGVCIFTGEGTDDASECLLVPGEYDIGVT